MPTVNTVSPEATVLTQDDVEISLQIIELTLGTSRYDEAATIEMECLADATREEINNVVTADSSMSISINDTAVGSGTLTEFSVNEAGKVTVQAVDAVRDLTRAGVGEEFVQETVTTVLTTIFENAGLQAVGGEGGTIGQPGYGYDIGLEVDPDDGDNQDFPTTKNFNDTSCLEAVEEICRDRDWYWYVNAENVVWVVDELEPETHELQYIKKTSAGLQSPPYRRVIVTGGRSDAEAGFEPPSGGDGEDGEDGEDGGGEDGEDGSDDGSGDDSGDGSDDGSDDGSGDGEDGSGDGEDGSGEDGSGDGEGDGEDAEDGEDGTGSTGTTGTGGSHLLSKSTVQGIAGSEDPTYRYQDSSIHSADVAQSVAVGILEEFMKQRASGQITIVGDPTIRPQDVVTMPDSMGGEQYIVSTCTYELSNSDGFITKIGVGALVDPAEIDSRSTVLGPDSGTAATPDDGSGGDGGDGSGDDSDDDTDIPDDGDDGSAAPPPDDGGDDDDGDSGDGSGDDGSGDDGGDDDGGSSLPDGPTIIAP